MFFKQCTKFQTNEVKILEKFKYFHDHALALHRENKANKFICKYVNLIRYSVCKLPTKMDLHEVECRGIEWNELAQDRDW